jgi:hypothetical protein
VGGSGRHAATAARIYDYMLGGIHNFPADQQAARQLLALFPFAPMVARANRAFLRRAVGHIADAGVEQFIDLGSGIPTKGNVHEIAQKHNPRARVVYVDLDPVAVAESLDILEGNSRAVAIRADLRDPAGVLAHPRVRGLLNFDEPVAVLFGSVLHFVADDAQAYGSVSAFVDATASGSYLLISHGALEAFAQDNAAMETAAAAYKRDTAILGAGRTREQVARFFDGLELVDPGVVWVHEWRSRPQDQAEFADSPHGSGEWAAVAAKP